MKNKPSVTCVCASAQSGQSFRCPDKETMHPWPLRKHVYSNILEISPLKPEKFSDKNSDIYHISAQNIDCGYLLEPPCRGGSNEYPQYIFLSRYRKIVYLLKPQFYYVKVGFKGVKLYRYFFVMAIQKYTKLRYRSDCAKADLKLHVAHMSECTLFYIAAHFITM